jgi:hypothetical protein
MSLHASNNWQALKKSTHYYSPRPPYYAAKQPRFEHPARPRQTQKIKAFIPHGHINVFAKQRSLPSHICINSKSLPTQSATTAARLASIFCDDDESRSPRSLTFNKAFQDIHRSLPLRMP